MAPVRTIQIRNKYAECFSEDTKKLLKVRNETHDTAMNSKDPDDWRYTRISGTLTQQE